MIAGSVLSILEIFINPVLMSDELAVKELASIAGKRIKIVITDWNISFSILVQRNGIQLLIPIPDEVADVYVNGQLFNLSQILFKKSAATSLVQASIEVIGDLELAEKFNQILRSLDIDWEGITSKIFGDWIGMQLINQMSQFKQVMQRTGETLKENMRSYLQVEVEYLPEKQQVLTFYERIAVLRDDVERIAIQMDRLMTEKI